MKQSKNFKIHCRKQLVRLKENVKKYKEMDIPIIIVVGQKREGVKKWLHENPMPFPFLIDEERSVIEDFNVYHSYGLSAYKIAHRSLFFISEEGKVVYCYVGKNQADRPTDDQLMRKFISFYQIRLHDKHSSILL